MRLHCHRLRRSIPALVATLILAGPALAQPAPENSALEAYRAGEYQRAATLFERAYKAAPSPDVLYGWAQSLRMSGACARARQLYDRLLADKSLTPARRDAVRASRARTCTPRTRQAPVKPPPRTPEPKPALVTGRVIGTGTPGGTRPTPAPRTTTPWYRDSLGHGLLAAGVVSSIAGGYLFRRSAATRRDAAEQTSLDRLEDMFDRARRDRGIAVAALATGGALLVGAVLRYATVNRRSTERRIDIGAALLPGGASAMVSTRF